MATIYLTVAIFHEFAIPRRTKANTHTKNAENMAIPAMYRYPRGIRRTILGFIVIEELFSGSTSASTADAEFASWMTACGARGCALRSVGRRYFVIMPDISGNKTNGTAINAAPVMA
jgi:hypothetical protein